MEELLVLSSSSAAILVLLVITWFLWKNGYLDGLLPGLPGPSGEGRPLPTPPLQKSKSPWYVISVSNDDQLSIYRNRLRIDYVRYD